MINQAKLKLLFRYSPYTGTFYDVGTNNMRLGFRLNGYTAFKISGRIYYAHRLAWLYMTGRWPKQIDHKNGKRWDNRWLNLRLAGLNGNACNRKPKSNTKLGLKGVVHVDDRFRNKPYQAKIVVHGKPIYLGYFATPEQAHAAYRKASPRYHGKFGRCS